MGIMAEGGVLPWKVQTIKENGPVADYSKLSQPLIAPKGMVWHQDKVSKEWSLIEKDTEKARLGDGIASTNEASLSSSSELKKRSFLKKKISFKKRIDVDVAVPIADIPIADKIAQDKLKHIKKDAVKGVDYVEHLIQPSDTFQGLCLTYNISATKLRQVNMFSGTNLKLAPSKLIIPIESKTDKLRIDAYEIRKKEYNAKEGKVHAFLAEFFPKLKEKEARL